MMNMKLLFFVLLLIPVIEIGLFIEAGTWIGTLNTLLLILATAAIGITLIRQQGLQTLFRARTKMDHGEVPAYEMMEGMILAIAGVLLLTPGFFTDSIGFILLLPMIQRLAISRMTNMSTVYTQTRPQSEQHRTIEGEFKDSDKNE